MLRFYSPIVFLLLFGFGSFSALAQPPDQRQEQACKELLYARNLTITSAGIRANPLS